MSPSLMWPVLHTNRHRCWPRPAVWVCVRCSAIDRLLLISDDKTSWPRLVYGRGGRDGDGEQMARDSAPQPEVRV